MTEPSKYIVPPADPLRQEPVVRATTGGLTWSATVLLEEAVTEFEPPGRPGWPSWPSWPAGAGKHG